MNIESSIFKVVDLYYKYCKKKKKLEAMRVELNSNISAVCCHFKCSNCPLLNMCEKTGGFKELDEQ